MKKLLLNLLFIFATVVSFAQSLPNVWFPTAGTTTAYTVNVTNYGAAYNNKLAFVQFTAENTGPATINVNGLGPKGLRLWNGTNWVVLVAGDLPDSTRAILAYNQQSGYMEVTKLRNEGSGGGSQDFQSVLDNGASANIGNAGMSITAEDASNYAQFNLSPESLSISSTNIANTESATLETSVDGVKIVDTRHNRGLQGTDDYSPNIQANDFTQKNYVDAGLATKEGTLTNSAGLRSALSDESGPGVALFAGTGGDNIANTPAGNIAATDVQAAINELDGDKAPLYITHNRQTGSYSLVLSDVSKTVEMNVAGSNDLTVPANSSVAFPTGTMITIVQYGAGTTTVVASGGVTIHSSGNTLVSPGRYAPMVLQKIATDEWYLWNGSPSVTLESGTYTPTLTSVTNVAASTANACTYMRLGNTVTVSGSLSLDPTSTGNTQLGISLPTASAFTTALQCGGTANYSALGQYGAAIRSDATNDRAELVMIATDVTNQVMYFTFTYQVL